jgi:hypothetical protein
MSAPVAYNEQPVELSTKWVGYSYGLATMTVFLVLAAIALGKRRYNRPRIYRGAFCALIGCIGFLAVYGLRIPEDSAGTALYLDQTAAVWDGTLVQVGYWDFAALGWLVIWLGIGLFSYAPSVEVLSDKRPKRDEAGNALPVSEKESLDMNENINHWVPGHVLLNVVFNVFLFGAIALQQAYPMALWYLVPVGAVAIACLIVYYIFVAYLMSLIPKKIGAEKKIYRSYMIFVVIFGFISIIVPVIAAGLSPAVATTETTFALNTVIWMTVATALGLSIIFFAAMIYYDFVHAKSASKSSSKNK